MHANYAVYLCSRVCELVSDRTRLLELGEDNGCDVETWENRWLGLWEDLQLWLRDRPDELLPFQTIETRPFPLVMFVHWAAISSNQLYHTACILLLNCSPPGLSLDLGAAGSLAYHARIVCGISITNPHEGCLNNAIQPLWLAGRFLSSHDEHSLLINLISSIESRTGWATRWRIPDLEAAWGYEAGRSRSFSAR